MVFFNQTSLFESKVIPSVSSNEQELLKNILKLYVPSFQIDCDPTYSIGRFYKQGIPQPIHKFDIVPQKADVIQASAEHIPLPDKSCQTVMFDPPFITRGVSPFIESAVNDNPHAVRFGYFNSFETLKTMYFDSMCDIYRILKKDGILIVKCQDTISGGKNQFSHCWTMFAALKIGFSPIDLFILINPFRILGKHTTQRHARKYHCYFWVFQKTKCKVDYSV